VRGILRTAAYIPYRRLERAEISEFFSSPTSEGQRSVAAHDEDTVTMAFEAARLLLIAQDNLRPSALWFSTANPPYMEKTNANVIHSALQLPEETEAFDFGGGLKSSIGALKTALTSTGQILLAQSDMRNGLPSGEDERNSGDGAAALLVGDETDGTLLARYMGGSSITKEFIDRWRTPEDKASKTWESRFVESTYSTLVSRAWDNALSNAGLKPDTIDTLVLAGQNQRVKKQVAQTLGVNRVLDDLSLSVGNTGSAESALLLVSALENAEPKEKIALCSITDGVEILIFEAGDAQKNKSPLEDQIAKGGPVTYRKFLQWKGMLQVQPPNRPSPTRISAAAAVRESEWKHGFIASRGDRTGLIHMPPSRISVNEGDQIDAMEQEPMSNKVGVVATFTVDHLVYSENPPVIFAVVDFDGGGRIPIEVTDVDPDDVTIGMQVAPTFRKFFTADGIHNYFWKVRPVR